jgi:hypothetical protein
MTDTKDGNGLAIRCNLAFLELFTFISATSIGNAIRASWTFGQSEHANAATGTDYVVVDDDMIGQLFAFVDLPDK